MEVTLEDIETANRLADEVLGRSLDELSPQTRRLLLLVEEMVAETSARLAIERSDYRFSRKDVRDATGWTDFQVRTHLEKLTSLEYVLVHRGGRGQSFVYELLYDGKGKDGRPFLVGLLDVERLRGRDYDSNFEGSRSENEHRNGENEGPSSPHRASNEPPSRSPRIAASAGAGTLSAEPHVDSPENAHLGREEHERSSYAQRDRSGGGLSLAARVSLNTGGGF